MKGECIVILLALALLGCKKDHENTSVVPAYIPEGNKNVLQIKPITEGMLLGKWVLLNSEGNKDSSGDYLFLQKSGNNVVGDFVYQKHKRSCRLANESGEYYIVSMEGEQYKITRSQSTKRNAKDDIWLALDDIDLGIFQRVDSMVGGSGS